MSVTELYRAPLAYTRADPRHDAATFVWHADGALMIRDGRIVAGVRVDGTRVHAA